MYTSDMYMTILGRQSALGLAELERAYGSARRFSASVGALDAEPDVLRLGGSVKTGRIVLSLPRGEWRDVHTKIIQHYEKAWASSDHKITLGISAYDLRASPRDIQRTGIDLKKRLKQHDTSLRLIPNTTAALSSATSHHNKLGLSASKVELLVAKGLDGSIIVAESTGAQHITALARRDQGRPKRDAFVGMLPPKLAQIIINLAVGTRQAPLTVLDPFCGTGVVLQEAMLMGYDTYGTDLADKMIDFSEVNLAWAQQKLGARGTYRLAQGDAMTSKWQPPVDAVACETYLGQPFSAPPSPSKLREVRGNCNHIIGSFLANIASQLASGTPLCVAVPAWRASDGSFTHLPLTRELGAYGFRQVMLSSVATHDLLYYRDDQVVARELLILEKI